MEIVAERCCGVDVHKKMLVACLLIANPHGAAHVEIRTFSTMTGAILTLADWLTNEGCTHVAIESTGVYWKPVFNLLEERFAVWLVNPQHMKAVPGRKTDVKDAQWIAELLQHGLLRPSFIPPAPQRELRDLTRYRTSLVGERAQLINRLQKLLEDTNIELSSVAADIVGVSGRAMLAAIADGETDAAVLANMARRQLRRKLAELEYALVGNVKAHHRFMLKQMLAQLTFLEEQIAAFDAEIDAHLGAFVAEIGAEAAIASVPQTDRNATEPSSDPASTVSLPDPPPMLSEPPDPGDPAALSLRTAVTLLDTIPGINKRLAEILLAEIGADMSRFPSAGHLASWAGLCPAHNESAGKRKKTTTTKGSRWLKQGLVEGAQGAMNSRDTYLGAQGRRLTGRLGKKKAVVAVAHSMIVIVYHVLKTQQPYRDLGKDYSPTWTKRPSNDGHCANWKRWATVSNCIHPWLRPANPDTSGCIFG